jgi:hypothetical protein
MTLEWAHTEVAVIRRLFPRVPGIDAYEASLRRHTARSNEQLFKMVEAVADFCLTARGAVLNVNELRAGCEETRETVTAERNAFVTRHQHILLRALAAAA